MWLSHWNGINRYFSSLFFLMTKGCHNANMNYHKLLFLCRLFNPALVCWQPFWGISSTYEQINDALFRRQILPHNRRHFMTCLSFDRRLFQHIALLRSTNTAMNVLLILHAKNFTNLRLWRATEIFENFNRICWWINGLIPFLCTAAFFFRPLFEQETIASEKKTTEWEWNKAKRKRLS